MTRSSCKTQKINLQINLHFKTSVTSLWFNFSISPIFHYNLPYLLKNMSQSVPKAPGIWPADSLTLSSPTSERTKRQKPKRRKVLKFFQHVSTRVHVDRYSSTHGYRTRVHSSTSTCTGTGYREYIIYMYCVYIAILGIAIAVFTCQ